MQSLQSTPFSRWTTSVKKLLKTTPAPILQDGPKLSVKTRLRSSAVTTSGVGLAALLGYMAYPFALTLLNKLKQPALPDLQVAQRRQAFEQLVIQQAMQSKNQKINWYQFADIVDKIAHNTPTDETFREDLWYLFGWRDKNVRSPLAEYLDPTNFGLPVSLHNSHYQSEQMHHYLGGATGNMQRIPSHLQNNHLYAYIYELSELFQRGQYNWGDVRLFNVAEKHRNAFLMHGRFSVAPNIRALLLPQFPAFAPIFATSN